MDTEKRFYTSTMPAKMQLLTQDDAIESAKQQLKLSSNSSAKDGTIYIVQVMQVVRRETPAPPPIIVERL